jgi:hypothetical protein
MLFYLHPNYQKHIGYEMQLPNIEIKYLENWLSEKRLNFVNIFSAHLRCNSIYRVLICRECPSFAFLVSCHYGLKW